MRFIQSLSDIVSDGQYDAIASDVYGVLHDGVQPYPYSKQCLKELYAHNFKTFLLSNSSRLGTALAKDLHRKFGIDENTYERVISSGDLTKLFLEACYNEMRGSTIENTVEKCVATMLVKDETHAVTAQQFAKQFIKTGRFYLAGDEEYHSPLYEHLSPEISRVPFSSEIDFVLVGKVIQLPDQSPMDPNDTESVKQHYTDLLNQCLAARLPLIVANPDVQAPNGTYDDGTPRLLVCPGYIGQLYREMGGCVLYFGKPFTSIYQYLIENVQRQSPTPRILCVGDNVATDVLGARSMGLDVALVLDGVHNLSVENGQCASQIQHLCKEHQSPEPTYALQHLRF